MALITGAITDSTGTPLDGTLTFLALQAQGEGGTIYLPTPHDYSITAGTVNIQVPPGSYQVTFKDPSNAVLWDIKTTIAEVDTTIDALPGLVIADRYNSSLTRIAKILVDNFSDQLAIQFNSRGEWDVGTTYFRNDLVSYQGSSYLHSEQTATTGVPPTVTSTWALIAEKGDTGTGTTGVDTPYSAAWDGGLDAPTQNALYDILSTLAPLESPILTGVPTAPIITDIFDATGRLATTAWVQQWRQDGPGIKSLTSQTMRVEAGPFSFKLAWGFYTTPSVTWTTGDEQQFDVIIPDSFTIDNQRAIVVTIKGQTGSAGIYQVRAEPGLTNDRFTVALQMENDNNHTAAITISWFMAGA